MVDAAKAAIPPQYLQGLEHPEPYGLAGDGDAQRVDDLADLDFLGFHEGLQEGLEGGGVEGVGRRTVL